MLSFYSEQFKAQLESTNIAPSSILNHPLKTFREQAFDRFSHLGFPTRKDEDWRYTSFDFLTERFLPIAEDFDGNLKSIESFLNGFNLGENPHFVFLDGHFVSSLSNNNQFPKGVFAGSLKTHPELASRILKVQQAFPAKDLDAFDAFNAAFAEDLACLYVPKDLKVELPVYFIFLSSSISKGKMMHPRCQILLEENSSARVIEIYAGLDSSRSFDQEMIPSFVNATTEVLLSDQAIFEHIRIQEESLDTFHRAKLALYQKNNSQSCSHVFAFGGRVGRNEVSVELQGEGASSELSGLYIGSDSQQLDLQTTISHAKPHGTSRELYKGILSGEAKGIFNGKIIVQPNAQKTISEQTNKNLLLSEKAEANTKPLLEILANDVKCKHGATIGRLDQNAIFYLRSRGLSEQEARQLLTFAFANESIEAVSLEALKAFLKTRLEERLKRSL